MTITYVGGQVGGRAGATSTTNITFALSGGSDNTIRPGDLVVIGVTVASQARTPACEISGYTAGTQQNANGTTYDTSLNKSWKFMGLTPDTTFTLPSTGNIADAQRYTVQVWRGVDPLNPFDVADVVATGTGTGRPNPGSITPTTSGAVVGIIGAGAAATGAAYTAPANYTTNFRTGTTADTNDAMIGSGYRAWTSGAEDPAQYTGGTTNAVDSWAAFTYALRPEVSYLPTLISTEVIALGTSASPGAQNVTVPAGTQLVVVHAANYASAGDSTLSLSSNFAGTFTTYSDGDTFGDSVYVAYALVSSTGAKTITPVWSNSLTSGPLFFVSYIKGIDTAAFIRDVGVYSTGSASATASDTLATRAEDLLLVLDKDGTSLPTAISGYTSQATQTNNAEYGRLQTGNAPGAASTTITTVGTNYACLGAIAIRGIAPSSDVTLPLVGVSGSTSTGSISTSQQVSKALVGTGLAANTGSLSPSVGISIELAGEQVLAQTGSTVVSQQVSKALSGAQVSGQSGLLSTSQQVSISLSGEQIVGIAGSIGVGAGVTLALSGANVTVQIGTPLVSQQVIKTLTGQLAVTQAGLLGTSQASARALSGSVVTASSGMLAVTQQVVKGLSGAQVGAQAGLITSFQQVSKTLSGEQISGQSGAIAPSQQITKALSGAQVSTQSGLISVGADLSIQLNGSQVAAQAGALSPAASLNVALTGTQIVAQAGSVTAGNQVIAALFGAQVTATTGTLGTNAQVVAALIGSQVAAQTGGLVAGAVLPQTRTVALGGSCATPLAGQIGTITQSQYPPPANVRAGVKYGPTGVEFTGTMGAAGYGRGRVVNE